MDDFVCNSMLQGPLCGRGFEKTILIYAAYVASEPIRDIGASGVSIGHIRP